MKICSYYLIILAFIYVELKTGDVIMVFKIIALE